MKKQFMFFLLFFIAHCSLAQAKFEYDQAGNRVKRTVTATTPDLTPIMKSIPNVVKPKAPAVSAPISVTVAILNLKSVPTNGFITVRVTKDSHCNLMFDPSLTTTGGGPVQNPNWSFSSDATHYIFTSTTVIAGNGESNIFLSGTITPGGTSGQLTISVVLDGGSGGESNNLNNYDADTIDYFP